MSDFFRSIRGTRFFDGTLPKIADSLERIANSLEKQSKEPMTKGKRWERLKDILNSRYGGSALVSIKEIKDIIQSIEEEG